MRQDDNDRSGPLRGGYGYREIPWEALNNRKEGMKDVYSTKESCIHFFGVRIDVVLTTFRV